MNIGRVLKYLITGVVVGAVLFFAGFGVVNLLKKDTAEPVVVQQPVIVPDATVATDVEVIPPSISVSEGTSNSPIKIKPLGAADDATLATEGDTPAEVTPAFGTLTLSAINSTNQQPLRADFLIQNDAGAAIAQVKDTAKTTLSFPVGSYKITVNQGTNKIVRYLGVKDGQNGSETFEIDAPVLDGEPAVATAPVGTDTPTTTTAPVANNAAVLVEEAPVANVAAQATPDVAVTAPQAAPESTVASEPAPTTATEPTVNTPTSDVTVTTNQQTDAASTSQEKGVGGLRVSALTRVGNRPMTASFYIQKLNGENIANIKNVTTHQFNLPAGNYRITARNGTTRMVKQINIVAARGIHEIFNMPSVEGATETTTVSAAPAVPAPAPAPTQAVVAAAPVAATQETGRLELFARDAASNKPVRSNFYIQTPQGKLVTSKTYVESIGYKLPSAPYKVTVRATGYKDKVTTLNVRKDQTRRETFQMELVAPAPAVVVPPVSNVSAPVAAPVQAVTQAPNPNRGGLQVNIVSAQGGPLKADIMVTRRNGTPVKRAVNASTANFDLAPRNFVVRVRHAGFVTNQQVSIKPGKLAIKTITFDLNTGFQR